MTKQPQLQGNPLNRARSLSDRIDEPLGLWATRELGCKLSSRATRQKICWPSPIFSRLALDIQEPLKWLPTLDKLRRNCGISIVEPEAQSNRATSDYLGSGADRSLDDGLSIQPLFVDEPIRFEGLMHAEQIELQFIPSRVQPAQMTNEAGNWANRWIPTLPSDLTDVEKMTKRIELIRSLSDQSTVVVGGAIPAGRVYEDVRFLIDCGVDYVNVLAHVSAGASPSKYWTLHPVDYVIEQAANAITKSGASDIALLVCSPIQNVQEAMRLISLGADAFSLDSWLIEQHAISSTTSQPTDDLSSFMGSYARQAAPTSQEGVVTAAELFLQDLNSLRRLYEI